MSARSRKEVLEQARQRYGKRGREGRSRLLDEVCEFCGYERKYAIKVLSGKRAMVGGEGRKRGGSQAIYGEAEREVIKAIWLAAEQPCGKRLKAALPFAILGFDTDNGGEFLNWHLLNYFTRRRHPVGFTRSRAYRKNDNARVEQKNWTHVRQLVGYARLEDPRAAELLNELYAKEWGWFRNFFCPAMKHLRTEVEGSRKRRVYDAPATPFERLKACAAADKKQIAALENLYRTLDPFALKEAIEIKLRAVLHYQNRRPLFKAA